MTILIGKRFDSGRIIIGADTMISEPTTRAEIVPGRLKVLALSGQLSIGYAGNYVRGIDAIKAVERNLFRWQELAPILQYLGRQSEGGCADFIIASHFDEPDLRKVSNGFVTANLKQVWAGHAGAVSILTSHESEALRIAKEHRDEYKRVGLAVDLEAHAFASGFFKMLLISPILLDGVGGLPVILDAIKGDHSYQNSAGAYAPGAITIEADGAKEELPEGGNRYGFQILGFGRNAPFTGVYLQEAEVGYVYAPLLEIKPTAILAPDANAVIECMRQMAADWTADVHRRRYQA